MTKRLVDIDDRLLSEAKCLLGAASTAEAVNRALAQVVRAEVGRRAATRQARPGIARNPVR